MSHGLRGRSGPSIGPLYHIPLQLGLWQHNAGPSVIRAVRGGSLLHTTGGWCLVKLLYCYTPSDASCHCVSATNSMHATAMEHRFFWRFFEQLYRGCAAVPMFSCHATCPKTAEALFSRLFWSVHKRFWESSWAVGRYGYWKAAKTGECLARSASLIFQQFIYLIVANRLNRTRDSWVMKLP